MGVVSSFGAGGVPFCDADGVSSFSVGGAVVGGVFGLVFGNVKLISLIWIHLSLELISGTERLQTG